MKNKLRIKKMDQARERSSGRQPIGWVMIDGKMVWYMSGKLKINQDRPLNPEE